VIQVTNNGIIAKSTKKAFHQYKNGIIIPFMDTQPLIKTLILRILKPLVHILIKHEVSHSEFSELARKAYVDVAYSDFAIPNRKMTVSRAAVLTGLSRKEVVRLSADKSKSPEPKITQNRAARVVTGWINDQDFLTDQGDPRNLALRGENSFTTLVERYSGDITSRAVLDELTRLELVSVEDKETVHLKQMGYIPNQDEIKQFDILSTCTKDLLSTGLFNMNKTEKERSRFQRQLIYRQVNADVAAEFAQLSQQKSQELLLEFDQWLKQQQSTQPTNANQIARIGLGIYYFEEVDHEDT
jgi:hypothetical protein